MINIHQVGAQRAAKVFQLLSVTADERCERVVRKHGLLLNTKIKGRASGRPGPRAVTGDYRRSWTVQFGRQGGGPSALVGTNAPQGRRLEYGFVGTDSLGRNYNQPPFPHVRPSMDEVEPAFVAELAREALK